MIPESLPGKRASVLTLSTHRVIPGVVAFIFVCDCQLAKHIERNTEAIDENRRNVEKSTHTLRDNANAIEESTAKIVANGTPEQTSRRLLPQMPFGSAIHNVPERP